jgi:hypothetical protein
MNCLPYGRQETAETTDNRLKLMPYMPELDIDVSHLVGARDLILTNLMSHWDRNIFSRMVLAE